MSKSEPWSDCFGQPAADMRMAEIHLRRAVRRARRMAEQGVPPSSIYADAARIRDRAASRRNWLARSARHYTCAKGARERLNMAECWISARRAEFGNLCASASTEG